jgi:hypothetical protein
VFAIFGDGLAAAKEFLAMFDDTPVALTSAIRICIAPTRENASPVEVHDDAVRQDVDPAHNGLILLIAVHDTPRTTNRSHSASMTSVAFNFRPTRMAIASRGNSSMMQSIRNAFPSWVRSATKS